MKKIISSLCIMVLLFGFLGCGSSSSSSSDSGKSDKVALSKDEFNQMYSNVSKYEGRSVDFYARIFTEPEKDSKGTYIQAYANDDKNKNTIIGIADPKLDVKEDDIIHVIGTLKKEVEGKNALGGSVKAAAVKATKIEKADYATAFAPAIKTIQVNKEINQNGYIMKLNKVEIAEKETRLYMTVNNTTKDKISFYSFDTNITQGNSQFNELVNFDEKVKKIDGDILPGITQEGVLILDPVKLDGGNLKVICKGSSDNYDLKFQPFTFDVALQ